MSEELTTSEQARLAALKEIVKRGMESFIDVGRALTEIRDSRLYRETHQTFEAFCREEWSFGRSYAYEVIQAARAAEIVSENPDIPKPPNAGVAAELIPLCDQPNELRNTWEEAIRAHGPQPTALQVRRIRKAHDGGDGQEPPPFQRRGDPEHDTRFQNLEDAVELLQMLPPPEQVVFPENPGDMEAFDEAMGWLADWTPRMMREWRQHRASLSAHAVA